MSQEKVDRYKQEKANRKKTMAKEKLKKKLYVVAGAVVGLVFLGWIAWSIPAERRAEQERQESIKLQQEMIAAIQSQMLAIQESATATGNQTTTSADNKTTGNETTSADENTTSEETTTSSEEETTK